MMIVILNTASYGIFLQWRPRRKERSNDVRTLFIKRYQNDDSQQEIASNLLVIRETVR